MIPQTFARFCAPYGFAMTPAQDVLTRVCFDREQPLALPKADEDLGVELFGSDVGEIPELARTTIVWVKGARIGGTRMSAMRLYQLALTVALDLAPGEKAYGLIVGPDTRLGRQVFAYALGAAKTDEKAGRVTIVRESADSFAFERHDGEILTIEVLPATAGGRAVRGRTLVGAVMTEAAHFRDSDFVVNDAEVFGAIHPRLVAGGQCILESTPWVESGVLFELWRDNFNHPISALVASCPTLLMRPDASTRAKVEAERRRDPDNAENEFDARFRRAGSTDFFDAATIDAAMQKAIVARPWARRAAGGDLGLTADSSALAVADEHETEIGIIDLVELQPEPGTPLKLSEVIELFAETLAPHGLRSFMADGWSREAAREHAEKHKVEIEAAPGGRQGKVDAYLATRDALREGVLGLPDNARLRAQLRSIIARPVPGGGLAISAPRRGGHGDLVSAIVLAVYQLRIAADLHLEFDDSIEMPRTRI